MRLNGNLSTDLDNDALTYLWTQMSGMTVALRNANTVEATFLAPTSLANDEALVFRLTVTDSNGASSSDLITVNVAAGVNDPPVANAGIDQNVDEATTVTLDGSGSNDPENTTLTFIWTQTRPTSGALAGVLLQNAASDSPSFVVPNVLVNGTMVFQLVVRDAGGVESNSDTVTINVSGDNDPPLANAGEDQTVANGQVVTLDGSLSSDPEGEDLGYIWTKLGPTSGPGADVDLNDNTVVTPTFMFPVLNPDSPFVFQLVVSTTAGDGTVQQSEPDTVTITHADDASIINDLLLPELARAIAGTVGSISNRIQSASARAGVTIGGQRSLSAALQTHGKAVANETDNRRHFKQMLAKSEFVLPLHRTGGVDRSGVALWGSGGFRVMDGETGDLEWEGDLSNANLGIDALFGNRLLLGVSAAWQDGVIEFEDVGVGIIGDGEYEIDLNSVYPYFGWSGASVDWWGTLGYGEGDITITPTESEELEHEVEMFAAAGGMSGRVFQHNTTAMHMKAEFARTEMEVRPEAGQSNDDDTRMAVGHYRLLLEGRGTHLLDGGTVFEPSMEFGIRHDTGEGHTGSGAELGGGVRYRTNRVIAEGRARTMLAQGGHYREWGFTASVRMQPGRDGQGLSFHVSPTYGDTASGIDDLWGALPDADASDRRDRYNTRVNARLGYGLSLRNRDGIFTPYSELTFADRSTYRMGVKWQSPTRFNINLSGQRRENSVEVDNRILLKGQVEF